MREKLALRCWSCSWPGTRLLLSSRRDCEAALMEDTLLYSSCSRSSWSNFLVKNSSVSPAPATVSSHTVSNTQDMSTSASRQLRLLSCVSTLGPSS